MGNACACFGGDSDYAFSGRKRNRQEPDITDLDGGMNTAVPPGGVSHQKKAVSAKYEANDVNKNSKPSQIDDEPELNFTLQLPQQSNGDAGESSEEETISDEQSGVQNVRSQVKGTHVEVFSLSKPNSTAQKRDNVETVEPLPEHTGKTHVEVFSLNVADDQHMGRTEHEDSEPTETAHINFTAFLGDSSPNAGNARHSPGAGNARHSPGTARHSPGAGNARHSPDKNDVSLGADNFGYVSTETSSVLSGRGKSIVTDRATDIPVLDAGTATNVPILDVGRATNVPILDAGRATNVPVLDAGRAAVTDNERFEEQFLDVSKPGSQQTSTKPSMGVVNTSFISDDPEPAKYVVSHDQGQGRVTDLTDDSDSDGADENCFFFGMESLKFSSSRYTQQKEYDGEEADREIAEIMAEIDTIEEGVWLRLRPPTDDTDSVHGSDVIDHQTVDGTVYADVLDQLRDVCNKVTDILKRRGVDTTDGIDDDWLKLPELNGLNKKYDKKTTDIQTETVNRLVRASKNNDEAEAKSILEDYKRRQEKLLRMRDTERRKLLERLKIKMAARSERSSSRDDDEELTDEQTLRAQYGQLIRSDDESEEEILVDEDSSSEYTSYSSDGTALSYSDEESSQEDDAEGAAMLKTTLKHDIQSKLRDMTSDDFSSIMHLYRKERTGIRDIRDSERGKLKQSLWDKLAERRRHVDDSVYDGQTHGSPQTTSARQVDSSVSTGAMGGTTTWDHGGIATQTSHVTQDASTDVQKELESIILVDRATGLGDDELQTLNKTLLSQTAQTGHIDSQDVDQLMKEHFNNVKKLRDAREQAALLQRQKLLEKLHSHKTDTGLDIESLEKELKDEDNKRAKEEELLERECVQRLHERQTVTHKDMEEVLNQYKLSQDALNHHQTRQRELLNQRLQEKLSGRTRAGTSCAVGESDNTEYASIEKQQTQAEHGIAEMDVAFYKSLLERKGAGEMSEDELSRLLEEHLDEVEAFRRNIRKQLNQRRRERRQQGAAEHASALVEADRQQREHVRQLRKDERDKMDDKLKEKLKKRKQKREKDLTGNDGPDLPPRKEKKKRSHKAKDRTTDLSYENVDAV